MAREKPSVLYIHHDSELCMFFAFAREYVLNFPLSQQNFKARTWMKHRCKENYDSDFLNVPVEEYREIGTILLETTKIDSREYMNNIYNILIGWCMNDDSSSKRSSSHNSSSSKRSTSHLSRNSNSSTINSYRSRKSSHGHHKYSKGKKERKEKEEKGAPPEHISVVRPISNKSIHFDIAQDDGISLQQYQEDLKQAQTQHTQGMVGFNAPVSPFDEDKFSQGATMVYKAQQKVYQLIKSYIWLELANIW